jgi:hypothetical protein
MSEEGLDARMMKVEDTLARIETKLDTALTNINDHECRLRSLESKGGKRWDGLITQIIGLVIAAIFGLIAGKYM